jgi:hypothetical protein
VALRPEEIIAEIRKAFPTERVTTLPRPEIPRVTAVNENLYGVPIYVYGEGFRGQYLRHAYIDRMGVRYWAIETGRVAIYGELRDGRALPLVVLGQPTHFVYEFKPRDFRRFFREEVPTGYLECQERQIINLDRAMRAEDPVIIVDKYDLLRSATPSEFIERVKEYNSIIEALQRSLWEHEKVLADYRSNVSMLSARVAKLQELLAWSEERVVKLATEVTGIQTELLRLREEIRVRGAEAEALEETQRRLRDIIDRVSGLVRDLVEWGEVFKKAIERKPPEKPAEGAPK